MAKGVLTINKGDKVIVKESGLAGVVRSTEPVKTGQRGRPVTLFNVQLRQGGKFVKGTQAFRLADLAPVPATA